MLNKFEIKIQIRTYGFKEEKYNINYIRTWSKVQPQFETGNNEDLKQCWQKYAFKS